MRRALTLVKNPDNYDNNICCTGLVTPNAKRAPTLLERGSMERQFAFRTAVSSEQLQVVHPDKSIDHVACLHLHTEISGIFVLKRSVF